VPRRACASSTATTTSSSTCRWRRQGDARTRGGHRGQHDRHGDGAQRHGLRHPRCGTPGNGSRRPRPIVEGLWLPGFTAEDANPDIGDSSITETAGWAASRWQPRRPSCASSGAPRAGDAGDAGDVRNHGDRHELSPCPALDFQGTPLGIDVRKVMASGILPFINTGIAHKEPASVWSARDWCARPASVSSRHLLPCAPSASKALSG
jgi:hypothetical protein